MWWYRIMGYGDQKKLGLGGQRPARCRSPETNTCTETPPNRHTGVGATGGGERETWSFYTPQAVRVQNQGEYSVRQSLRASREYIHIYRRVPLSYTAGCTTYIGMHVTNTFSISLLMRLKRYSNPRGMIPLISCVNESESESSWVGPVYIHMYQRQVGWSIWSTMYKLMSVGVSKEITEYVLRLNTQVLKQHSMVNNALWQDFRQMLNL